MINPRTCRSWSLLGPNGTFGLALDEMAEVDDKLVVTTGDLIDFSGLNRYVKNHPDKFYDIGIAEQNMIGIAAGLVNEGFHVFCTTYAAFASTRCMDQVKINMSLMNLPIKLVGLSSGFSMSSLGSTHMSCDDIGIMRSLPNITIICPADGAEIQKAVTALISYDKPAYLRITGTTPNPIIYTEEYSFEIGKAIQLKDGDDIALITNGRMVSIALDVAKMLENNNISCKVLNMHTIKPLDGCALDDVTASKLVVTIEEHNVIGGLGTAVAEYFSSKKEKPPLMILGVNDKHLSTGTYEYTLERCGLTSRTIVNKIIDTYDMIK